MEGESDGVEHCRTSTGGEMDVEKWVKKWVKIDN